MRRNIISERKLLIAVLTFLISLSSMVTSTLAWFSSSNYLEVDRFRITVGDQEKIEFGLVVPFGLDASLGEPGDIVYFSELDQDILQSYGYFNPWEKMKPVSSMYQSLWLTDETDLLDETTFNQINPQFRTHYTGGTNYRESRLATEGFYQFEFFMRANYDVDLYLDQKTTLVADEEKNRQTAIDRGMVLSNLNGIKDYMRVSFLTEEGYKIWEPNVDSPSQTKFGGRLDVLRYDSYFDYRYDDLKEIMFGEYNSDEFLVYNEEARSTEVDHFTSFNALSNPNVLPLNIPASEANGLVIARETTYTLSQLSNQGISTNRLVNLRANRPTRMVVSVYAEGWDLDTNSDSQFASFLLQLKLTGRITEGQL